MKHWLVEPNVVGGWDIRNVSDGKQIGRESTRELAEESAKQRGRGVAGGVTVEVRALGGLRLAVFEVHGKKVAVVDPPWGVEVAAGDSQAVSGSSAGRHQRKRGGPSPLSRAMRIYVGGGACPYCRRLILPAGHAKEVARLGRPLTSSARRMATKASSDLYRDKHALAPPMSGVVIVEDTHMQCLSCGSVWAIAGESDENDDGYLTPEPRQARPDLLPQMLREVVVAETVERQGDIQHPQASAVPETQAAETAASGDVPLIGMTGLRRLISKPLEFSFEPVRSEPFRFVVVSEPPPRGKDTEISPSGKQVVHQHEWGSEEVFSMGEPPRSWYVIRYFFTVQGADFGFFVHCLDSPLELFYDYMIGKDFGDKVIDLIRRRWPKTFQLLVNGCMEEVWPALVRLKTSTNQWAVTMPQSVSNGVCKLSPQNEQMLFESAVESAREMAGYEALLSEFIPILGGDDLVQRRLKFAGRLFNKLAGGLDDISNIAEAFS